MRFALTSGLAKNTTTTFYFEYEGTLESADDSPVQGLKLAYVGPDTSYLLYSGLWFPVAGYGVNRFTSTISVTVPAHMVVIGSGKEPSAAAAATQHQRSPRPRSRTPRPSPSRGTSRVSRARSSPARSRNSKATKRASICTCSSSPINKDLGAEYASTAVKEFTYFVTQYGVAPSTHLKIVEIPDDTVPSAWAPEIAAISSRAITEKINYRLLANTIAHQWWGVSVSPASKDDWWISDGFSRYSEARYVESAAGAPDLRKW